MFISKGKKEHITWFLWNLYENKEKGTWTNKWMDLVVNGSGVQERFVNTNGNIRCPINFMNWRDFYCLLDEQKSIRLDSFQWKKVIELIWNGLDWFSLIYETVKIFARNNLFLVRIWHLLILSLLFSKVSMLNNF